MNRHGLTIVLPEEQDAETRLGLMASEQIDLAMIKACPMKTRYHVHPEPIGRSLYGRVYKAWCSQTQQWVAIKASHMGLIHYREKTLPAPAIADNPIREAQVCRDIQTKFGVHPNILQMVDEFVFDVHSQTVAADPHAVTAADDAVHFLITEYAPAGDLFERVSDTKRPPLTGTQIKHIWLQIVSAVKFLHETCGYVHLDISLENVFVMNRVSLDVKLADFGVAIPMNQLLLAPFSPTVFSKAGYMAPEVLDRMPLYSPFAADVFALGTVFFMLMTGFRPFVEARMSDRSYQYVSQQQWDKFFGQYGLPSPPRAVQDVFNSTMAHRASERSPVQLLPTLPFFVK